MTCGVANFAENASDDAYSTNETDAKRHQYAYDNGKSAQNAIFVSRIARQMLPYADACKRRTGSLR